MKKFLVLITIISALLIPACGFAEGWTPGSDEYWIRINKARLQLTLYKGKSSVVSYPVAIGRGRGTVKKSRFDFITPAGSYTIWRVIQDAKKIKYDPSWFNEPGEAKAGVYGSKLISFRNNWQIAIHGTSSPRSIGRRVTHGCIRLRNRDITQLVKFVHPPMHLEIVEGAAGEGKGYSGTQAVKERALIKESI